MHDEPNPPPHPMDPFNPAGRLIDSPDHNESLRLQHLILLKLWQIHSRLMVVVLLLAAILICYLVSLVLILEQ